MSEATQRCEFCGSPAHVWFSCTKKPDGWKPDRLHATPKTEMAKDVAPPVETYKRGRGRPKTISDMKAYKAEKAKTYRDKKKAEAAK